MIEAQHTRLLGNVVLLESKRGLDYRVLANVQQPLPGAAWYALIVEPSAATADVMSANPSRCNPSNITIGFSAVNRSSRVVPVTALHSFARKRNVKDTVVQMKFNVRVLVGLELGSRKSTECWMTGKGKEHLIARENELLAVLGKLRDSRLIQELVQGEAAVKRGSISGLVVRAISRAANGAICAQYL